MKCISPELEEILNHPQARRKLMGALLTDQTVQIEVNGKTYEVGSIDEESDHTERRS